MIIKDNMANMCAKVTSTYMEFTLAFGPKPEFSFSFKSMSIFQAKKSTEQTQTFVLYFFSFALCYDQIFIKRTFAINQTFRD